MRGRSGGGSENANPNLRDVNVTVDGHGLDTMIPTIPKPNKEDIKAGFRFKILTAISGRPTYEKMKEIVRQLARNALTVKVSFGGGKHGVLALVIGDNEFLKETAKNWVLPATQGAFPTIVASSTAISKKKTISKFIQDETDILIVEVAGELLKGQFIDAIEECYIKELREGYSEYDNRSLFELLEHVKTKYASLDDHVLADIRTTFEEPPDLAVPIDVYFEKQEECQRQAKDSEHPISDAEMVRMLQKHMGDSGTFTKKKVKFDKKAKIDRTWSNGKAYYRDAIEDMEEAAKCAGTNEFLANSTVATAGNVAAEEKVRGEMAAKMGESFDALAMAAEMSKTTYEDQARTIATLTAANAELTTTNKKLTDKIVTLAEKLAAATKSSGQGGNAPPGFESDGSSTGSAANSDGVFMPTRKKKFNGRMMEFFVSKQKCGHCGKLTNHLPEFCKENPRRKAVKEAEAALAKAKADAMA